MRLRDKTSKEDLGDHNRFNICAMSEVDVGDDSVFISDLEVWVVARQAWVSLSDAFLERLVIVDNLNTYFREPKTEEERTRGYYY